MADTPYQQAGGDPGRLALYQQLGRAEGLRAGSGRVLASVNPAHGAVGALGDLTGDQQTIAAGEQWLRDQGCVAAQAPLEQATWFPYRACLGPFDEPPFFAEPTASPMPWMQAGYRPVAHYTSALCDNRTAARYGESKRPAGYRLERMGDWDTTLPLLHDLATRSFQDAYAYSPISLPLMQALYAPVRPHLVPELVLLAYQGDTPVGFVFGIPDLLVPNRGRFLVKTLAVLPEHRRTGLGAWLVGAQHAIAQGLGFTHGVHALMWSGSRSQSISAHGGRVFRRYALYLKEL
jgi:GNAT superfamily N-acetyltransferase